MKINYSFSKLLASLILSAVGSFVNAQTYCNPTYSSGCTSWRITQVTIPQASFDNSFASGTCISGRDRTSTIVALSTATNYNINITTTGWVACGMAIDFNQDGDFADAGETLYLPAYLGNTATETYSGTFTIPSTVSPGNYRMRIWNRLANSGAGTPTADSACSTYGYGTWTDYTANVLGPLATSEVTKATAKIYPNPVSDVLNIENKNAIESIEIYDANGKLIRTVVQKGNNASVKLSDLVPGSYVAKIKTRKDNQTVKFIKK